MALLIIEHMVGDFETFKTVFMDDEDRRRRGGSRGARVYRVADHSNDVRVVLEFDTLQQARDTLKGSSCTRRSKGPRATCRCRASSCSSR